MRCGFARIALILAALCGGLLTARFRTEPAQVVAAGNNLGFSLTFLVESTDRSGNVSRHSAILRRLPDGRTLEQQDGAKSILVNPAVGTIQYFDAASRKVSTLTLNPGLLDGLKQMRSRRESCSVLEGFVYEGTEAVHGLRAERMARLARPDGMESRVWLSPELGCQWVKEETVMRQDGVTVSRNQREVVSVELREPDPRLFDVVQGFEEVPLDQLTRSRLRLADPGGGAAPECVRRTLEAQAERYRTRGLR
jgi:hypothetical protein